MSLNTSSIFKNLIMEILQVSNIWHIPHLCHAESERGVQGFRKILKRINSCLIETYIYAVDYQTFERKKNNSYNTYLQTYFSPSSSVMTKEDWPKGCQTANFTCNNRRPWPQWQLPVRCILKLVRNWGEQISLYQGTEIGYNSISVKMEASTIVHTPGSRPLCLLGGSYSCRSSLSTCK